MIRQTMKGLQGSIIPLGILTFLGLLFLSIHSLFDAYTVTAAVFLASLYLWVVLWIVKHKLTTVEYLFAGSVLTLKILMGERVIASETIPMRDVTAIGYGERLRQKDTKLRCKDFCVTFRGKHQTYLLIYYKAEDGTQQKLKLEPNEALTAALRRQTVGKFYETEEEESEQ